MRNWRIHKSNYLACLSCLRLVLLFYGFVLRLIEVDDYSAIVLVLSQIEIEVKFTVFILEKAEITLNLDREG